MTSSWSGIITMGKRKDGGNNGEDDQTTRSSFDHQPPTKRARRGTMKSYNEIRQYQMRLCQEILETLRNHRTEDGRLLAENFLRAPSRRISPLYHKLVANPIDLMRIQQKLKNDEYDNVEQFAGDVKNLSENAKCFYNRVSVEYKDAVDLWQLFLDLKSRYLDNIGGDEGGGGAVSETSGRSRESSPAHSTRSLRSNSPGRFSITGGDSLDKCYLEEFLAGLLEMTDENGRNISLAFRQLPSQQEYPEYYNVITHPIDLKTIARKLRKGGYYRNLNDIQRDLSLMCRNAKTFNEPKSSIYKDANLLKKTIESRRSDILDLATTTGTSSRSSSADNTNKSRFARAAAILDELLKSAAPAGREIQKSEPGVVVRKVEKAEDYEAAAAEVEEAGPSAGAGQSSNMEQPEPEPDLTEDSEEVEMKVLSSDNFWKVYWTVRNWKEPDQQQAPPLSFFFCRLPSKKDYPDYYDEIKKPISLFIINRKIKNSEYGRFVELIDDLNLVFNNAKFYNIEDSPIFKAACQLQSITNQLALEIDPAIDIAQYNIEIPEEEEEEEEEEEDGEEGEESEEEDDDGDSAIGGGAGNRSKDSGWNKRFTKGQCFAKLGNPALMAAFNAIVDYEDKDGRWLAEPFVERPSRKLYPDYYQVIPDPIDLKTIRTNIKWDKYSDMDSLAADIELLFSNARHYNEENSQIYKDAVILESVFKRASMDKTHLDKSPGKSGKSKLGRPRSSGSAACPVDQSSLLETPSSRTNKNKLSGVDVIKQRSNMRSLYKAITDHTDSKGNKLSNIFYKLPSKTDYPDYYEIIKKPLDLQKIHTRLSAKAYDNLESLVQDFNLVFDNACKYNDPESTIYKSALTLQRVLLQKKSELQEAEMDGKVPNVRTAVQELLTNLFIAVYNHEDEEGRCVSDSLAELPDLMKDAEPDGPVLSLDDIKHKLHKGRYRRLDRFQEDLFQVFDKARQLSRTDSQLFEDATELQQYFITIRNDLCKNGQSFASPALKFTEAELTGLVEEQRKRKQPEELNEDEAKPEDPRLSPSKKKDGDTDLQSVTIKGVVYQKGDFAYVKPNDEKLEPHIMRVERLWRDEGLGQEFISGNWYYRPYETYHRATRKFLEKEVFRTEFYDSVDGQRLLGKCYVMFVKDYFKFRPRDMEDADVYVCESKYMGKIRHFKKIKYWHIDMGSERVTFEERPEPVSASRVVPSVFSGRHPSHIGPSGGGNDEDEDEDYSILEPKQQEIIIKNSDPAAAENGEIYYEKINCDGLWIKLGDGVYVKSEGGDEGKSKLYKIDQLLRTKQGESYFIGSTFLPLVDVGGLDPSRLSYRQEIFATADRREKTGIPLSRINGKFAVLSLNDYVSIRPTEINEQDIFVCEYSLISNQQDAPPNLENHTIPDINLSSSDSLDQEYYRFKKRLRLEKQTLQAMLNPELELSEISERGVGSSSSVLGDVVAEIDTSDWLILKGLHTTPKLGARSKSGYILFSAVVRKKIMAENPDSSFGDISKIVGQEWKKLSDDDKKRYEEEAARIAQEREKADQAAGGRLAVQPGQIRVYCCKWKECDYQFETPDQLYDHITTAHTSQIVVEGDNQYVCLWFTCVKYRKDGKPFPSLPRLHRHMKDKHLPTSSKCIQPQNKSKHYFPLAPQSPGSSPAPSAAAHQHPEGQFQHPSSAVGGGQQSAPGAGQMASGQQSSAHQNQIQGGGQGQLRQGQGQSSAASTPQVVYYQQQQHHSSISGGGGQIPLSGQPPSHRMMIDPRGNVIPADHQQQQVVIYQVQQQQHQQLQGQIQAPPHPQLLASGGQSSAGQLTTTTNSDPGRLVVQRPLEPVFVAPPPKSQRVQRVMHSDVYIKYIEGLASGQSTNSRWDRNLGSAAVSRQNPPPPAPQQMARNLPQQQQSQKMQLTSSTHQFLHQLPETKEELALVLTNLRNHIMKDTLGLKRIANATSEYL